MRDVAPGRIIYQMKVLALLVIVALAGCDRSDAAGSPPAKDELPTIEMIEFGDFPYVERMKLPDTVLKWNGRRVRTSGYMNPGREVRGIKEFELVMNRDSCCYGTRPKMNHFFQTILKEGTTNYTSDPVTVVGRLVIEETWDGDWPLGLYWLKDAVVVK